MVLRVVLRGVLRGVSRGVLRGVLRATDGVGGCGKNKDILHHYHNYIDKSRESKVYLAGVACVLLRGVMRPALTLRAGLATSPALCTFLPFPSSLPFLFLPFPSSISFFLLLPFLVRLM